VFEHVTQLTQCGKARTWRVPLHFLCAAPPRALPLTRTRAAAHHGAHDTHARELTGAHALLLPIAHTTHHARGVREQVWELGCFFIRDLLGPAHEDTTGTIVNTASSWIGTGTVMENVRLERVGTIVADMTAIVTILHQSLPRRAAA
jgi:hypothetical protein